MKTDFLVFVPGSRSPPLGPWTLDEVRRRLRDGEIPATAKVCAVGDEEWKSLDEGVPPTPPKATPVDDDAVWFVHSTGLEKPVGPMSAAMVRLHLSAGEIPADAIAARKGDPDWIAVTNIAEAGQEIVEQEIDPEKDVATGYFRPSPEAVAALKKVVQSRGLELPPPRRTGAGPLVVTPRAPSLALLPVPVRPPPSAREPARESLATKLPSFSGSRLGSAVPAWVGKVRAQVVAHPVILPSIFGTALLVTLIAYASSARGFDERVRGLEATVSKLDSDLHAKDAELEKTRSLLEAADADLKKTRRDLKEAQTEIAKLKKPVIAAGLCRNLTTWTKPFIEGGDDLASVLPRFKKANLEAPNLVQQFINFSRFGDETEAKAKEWRKKEANLKALTVVDGEGPIRTDLLKGYDMQATAYEKYAEAFQERTKGLADLVGISEIVADLGKMGRASESELTKRCKKLGH